MTAEKQTACQDASEDYDEDFALPFPSSALNGTKLTDTPDAPTLKETQIYLEDLLTTPFFMTPEYQYLMQFREGLDLDDAYNYSDPCWEAIIATGNEWTYF